MMTSLLIVGAVLAIALAGAVTLLTLTENARHRYAWRPRVRPWRPTPPRPARSPEAAGATRPRVVRIAVQRRERASKVQQ
jgi:hypothetical protein